MGAPTVEGKWDDTIWNAHSHVGSGDYKVFESVNISPEVVHFGEIFYSFPAPWLQTMCLPIWVDLRHFALLWTAVAAVRWRIPRMITTTRTDIKTTISSVVCEEMNQSGAALKWFHIVRGCYNNGWFETKVNDIKVGLASPMPDAVETNRKQIHLRGFYCLFSDYFTKNLWRLQLEIASRQLAGLLFGKQLCHYQPDTDWNVPRRK